MALKSTVKDTLTKISGILSKKEIKSYISKAIQNSLDIDEAVVSVGLNLESIGDLKFHIVESDAINMQSEVTDHYIDTNRPVTDHVVKKPIEITLRGKIGIYPHAIGKDIGQSPIYYRNMNLITSFIPKIPGANLFRKVRQQISNVSSGNSIINSLVNTGISYAYGLGKEILDSCWHQLLEKYNEQPADVLDKAFVMKHKETEMFYKFYSLWQLSEPLRVTTYWKIFDNMIITNLRTVKEETDITEFIITLKQISTTSSIVKKYEKKQPTKGQASTTVNNGKTTGTNIPYSYTILQNPPGSN